MADSQSPVSDCISVGAILSVFHLAKKWLTPVEPLFIIILCLQPYPSKIFSFLYRESGLLNYYQSRLKSDLLWAKAVVDQC